MIHRRDEVMTGSYTSRELAVLLYGTATPSRHQVTAAAQWAARAGISPVQPGARVLRWPVGPVDAALTERAALRAAGKANRGNRAAAGRGDAARRGWATRRARMGDGAS
jgi:hypothetical protein